MHIRPSWSAQPSGPITTGHGSSSSSETRADGLTRRKRMPSPRTPERIITAPSGYAATARTNRLLAPSLQSTAIPHSPSSLRSCSDVLTSLHLRYSTPYRTAVYLETSTCVEVRAQKNRPQRSVYLDFRFMREHLKSASGARSRTRTGMPLLARDFKSPASTDFAIRAECGPRIMQKRSASVQHTDRTHAPPANARATQQ